MHASVDDRNALAETWLRYARSDEENAAAILTNREGNAAGVCFLAQQSAEKYLKALLVARSGAYERTHDFGKLLALLEPHTPGITDTLRDDTLTLDPYYIGTRYPADLPIESLT
ncbi:HEPN domain-containing protein [Candidatus Uhrbacteria bacterium]|nr:HEPN domain-containing protein [Candidatus Uhrbacteria bacterium]